MLRIETDPSLTLEQVRILAASMKRNDHKWGGVGSLADCPPIMTAAAGGVTYEQFALAGWTDAQLREHGYIL